MQSWNQKNSRAAQWYQVISTIARGTKSTTNPSHSSHSHNDTNTKTHHFGQQANIKNHNQHWKPFVQIKTSSKPTLEPICKEKHLPREKHQQNQYCKPFAQRKTSSKMITRHNNLIWIRSSLTDLHRENRQVTIRAKIKEKFNTNLVKTIHFSLDYTLTKPGLMDPPSPFTSL